eukprot:310179-Rhodomonas_salina.2
MGLSPREMSERHHWAAKHARHSPSLGCTAAATCPLSTRRGQGKRDVARRCGQRKRNEFGLPNSVPQQRLCCEEKPSWIEMARSTVRRK